MDENKDSSAYMGVCKGEPKAKEKLLEIFEYVKKRDYGNKGFDFDCKNPKQTFIDKYPQFKLKRDKLYRIDSKSRCLQYHKYDNWNGWGYEIDFNSIVDYFMLSGWKDINSTEPMYMWLIHKNEIIYGRKFWRRIKFLITNKTKYMLDYKKYEIEITK